MSGAPGSKAANRVLNGETVTRRRAPASSVGPPQAAAVAPQAAGAVLPFYVCHCPGDSTTDFVDDAGFYWDDCQ